MKMRFFWITDQVKRKFFDVQCHPGQDNLADYYTTAFPGKHHVAVRSWYIHGVIFSQGTTTGSSSSRYVRVCWNPRGWVIKSIPILCSYTGTKRAPRARAAAAIQAITVAILPIANMLGGAYNPFL